jgi:hypothetical protein
MDQFERLTENLWVTDGERLSQKLRLVDQVPKTAELDEKPDARNTLTFLRFLLTT